MRRLTLAICLLTLGTLLAVIPGTAQETKIYPALSSLHRDLAIDSGVCLNWNAGDVTICHTADTLTLVGGQLVLPRGSQALPSLGVGEASTGWYQVSTGNMRATLLGTDTIIVSAGQIAADGFAWSMSGQSSTLTGSNLNMSGDTIWGREAAAIWQSGADAAAPVDQTLKGPDGSGADKNAGMLTIAPGRPTGTGSVATLYFAIASTSPTSSSGQQALVNRLAVTEYGLGFPTPRTFATLGTPPNGTLAYCSDCDAPGVIDSTCTSSGTKTGSLAFRVNGSWKCIS